MKDRVLTYAIAISAVVHLAAVCVIGRTSAARLDAAAAMQPPRLLRVDLVRDPLEEPKPVKPPVVKPAPRVPDVPTVKPPQPAPPTPRVAKPPAPALHPPTAGNPGGKLSIGSTSPQGDLPGDWNGGKTPVGWVPGADIGEGAGSGTGAGVGTPDPPKNAADGPGTRPAPEPTPKTVSVRICAVSQMVAGKYCKNVDTKSFVEGTEPRAICNQCKKPEPVHTSRLADRQNPELVKDCKVSTAALEEGLNVTVKVEYTVTEDGDVADVKIVKSSGDRAADRAVLSAASRLKYRPAVQDGVARSVKMTRTYLIRT